MNDLNRLKTSDCLNDNLIDLRVRSIISGISFRNYIQSFDDSKPTIVPTTGGTSFPRNEGASMHAFSCHFYTALCQGKGLGVQRARSMAKHIQIFETDFLFIPVHKAGHWSLITVIRPYILAKQVCLQCIIYFKCAYISLLENIN